MPYPAVKFIIEFRLQTYSKNTKKGSHQGSYYSRWKWRVWNCGFGGANPQTESGLDGEPRVTEQGIKPEGCVVCWCKMACALGHLKRVSAVSAVLVAVGFASKDSGHSAGAYYEVYEATSAPCSGIE